MKPNEFDNLIKQKFDQSEFEYNPANWDKLVEEMDDRGKKPTKRLLMLLPLIAGSLAASIAMAVVIPFFPFHDQDTQTASVKTHVQIKDIAKVRALQIEPGTETAVIDESSTVVPQATHLLAYTGPDKGLAIHFNAAKNVPAIKPAKATIYPNASASYSKVSKYSLNPSSADEDYYSYDPANKPDVKTMISIAGGVNYGSLNTGYALGATAKRKLNSRFYLEGDVAVVNNSASQTIAYNVVNSAPAARLVSARMAAAPHHSAAKVTAAQGDVSASEQITTYTRETRQDDYNLYYAQVTPTVGYNIDRRISVGAGADLQRMLEDNRPTATPNDVGNVKQLPLFDVGVVGKTECEITKRIKAGVYYRQGVNNFITPMNKYIDRNYVQIQLKYTILNK